MLNSNYVQKENFKVTRVAFCSFVNQLYANCLMDTKNVAITIGNFTAVIKVSIFLHGLLLGL